MLQPELLLNSLIEASREGERPPVAALFFCPRIKVLAIRAYSEYTAQML